MIFRLDFTKIIYRKFFRFFKNEELAKLGPSLLFVNFIFQRLLGINSSESFLVHYTSVVQGVDKNKVSKSFKYCCASNGNANIVIALDTEFTVGENTIFEKNFVSEQLIMIL